MPSQCRKMIENAIIFSYRWNKFSRRGGRDYLPEIAPLDAKSTYACCNHIISLLWVKIALFNSLRLRDAYMHQGIWLSSVQIMAWRHRSLVQIMACHLCSAKPLSEPNTGILSIGYPGEQISVKLIWIKQSLYKKMHLEISSAKWQPFCPGLNVVIT